MSRRCGTKSPAGHRIDFVPNCQTCLETSSLTYHSGLPRGWTTALLRPPVFAWKSKTGTRRQWAKTKAKIGKQTMHIKKETMSGEETATQNGQVRHLNSASMCNSSSKYKVLLPNQWLTMLTCSWHSSHDVSLIIKPQRSVLRTANSSLSAHSKVGKVLFEYCGALLYVLSPSFVSLINGEKVVNSTISLRVYLYWSVGLLSWMTQFTV